MQSIESVSRGRQRGEVVEGRRGGGEPSLEDRVHRGSLLEVGSTTTSTTS